MMGSVRVGAFRYRSRYGACTDRNWYTLIRARIVYETTAGLEERWGAHLWRARRRIAQQ